MDADPARAKAELADLERLSRDALADVRRAVEGYRDLTLPGELARARAALEAAEIRADLPNTTDEVASDLRELFAWTVREGVTNVIRHSHARSCRVALDADLGRGDRRRPRTRRRRRGLRPARPARARGRGRRDRRHPVPLPRLLPLGRARDDPARDRRRPGARPRRDRRAARPRARPRGGRRGGVRRRRRRRGARAPPRRRPARRRDARPRRDRGRAADPRTLPRDARADGHHVRAAGLPQAGAHRRRVRVRRQGDAGGPAGRRRPPGAPGAAGGRPGPGHGQPHGRATHR